ncbi:SRPBCC domain-containing protein [Oligoflexus tunisiensis]|uniref:SRPBCC domain-containing protein n=1 Tax=Oligoflexus tunisiensis TaxID=708132 RepID=UPI00114CDB68|nr:SRPBCC domain-containing protein [Oligoflexus tunisiensis]
METKMPFHDTFTLERTFKARVSKVFDAFRKIELKGQWFIAPADYNVSERSLDFRAGGREVLRGSFPNGTTTSYDATYYDIVENERIVYVYDLLINGTRFSVTLATIEMKEEGGTTKLLFTEQNTYINAPADANASRIRGVSWHLDNLEKLLQG